jgi:hypothetical protein
MGQASPLGRNDIGCSHDKDHEYGEQDGEPEGRPGHATTMPTMSRRAMATRRQRSGRFGPAVDASGCPRRSHLGQDALHGGTFPPVEVPLRVPVAKPERDRPSREHSAWPRPTGSAHESVVGGSHRSLPGGSTGPAPTGRDGGACRPGCRRSGCSCPMIESGRASSASPASFAASRRVRRGAA